MPRLNSTRSSKKNTDVPTESWLLLYDTSRKEQSTESFSGSVLYATILTLSVGAGTQESGNELRREFLRPSETLD